MPLKLSWLAFFAGAFLMYFMAEVGPRFSPGVPVWSAQTTLFLLFFSSARLVVQPHPALVFEKNWGQLAKSFLFVAGLFALHLIGGIGWYVSQSSGPHNAWR